jgi:hypothetical protein
VQVGDAAEPLRVFERFLARAAQGDLSAAEREEFLEGELAQGEFDAHPREPLVCNSIVRLDATHAVARVTLEQPARKLPLGREGEGGFEVEFPAREVDTYWFLAKTDRWRIGAQRALAETGLLELMLALPEDPHSSDAEDAESRANARLILASDRELAAWFRDRKAEIQALAKAARELAAAGQDPKFKASSALGPLLRELHVSNAEVLADGGVDIVFGGLTDNVVLLRHVPSGVRPAITPHDVIWAEALGGGWFLVRTT